MSPVDNAAEKAGANTTIGVRKEVVAKLRLMAILEGVKLPELIERMVAARQDTYPDHTKLTLQQMDRG